MDREKMLALVHRSLALRHKLKVHDSGPRPDTHDDIAHDSLGRWELEDELHAIEELIRAERAKNVADKVKDIVKTGVKKKKKSA